MAIEMTDISDFFKLLVEWGGAFKVKDDMLIYYADDEPLKINIGKNELPLMLFHNNMPSGKHTFFNPLVEPIGHAEERAWFFTSRSMILGNLIKSMMVNLVNKAINDEDVGFDIMDIIKPFSKNADKKLIAEIESIPAINMLRILYNPRRRDSKCQTDIYDEEFQSSLKLRKRSWPIVQNMLECLIGVDEDEIESAFYFKSSLIGLQQTHSFLNTMCMVSMAIHEYVNLLLDKDLRVGEFEHHLGLLEKYRKACSWVATGTAQHDKDTAKEERSKPKPWMRNQSQPEPTMAINPTLSGKANADPMKFARMANAIKSQPWVDVNQIMVPQQGLFNTGGAVVHDPYGNIAQSGFANNNGMFNNNTLLNNQQSLFEPTFSVHEPTSDNIILPKLNI